MFGYKAISAFVSFSIGKSSTFPKKKLSKALLACIQSKMEKEKQRREVCELREFGHSQSSRSIVQFFFPLGHINPGTLFLVSN